MTLLTAIAAGLLDAGTANATNKANRENTNATIAAQGANQEKGLQALTGSDAFKTTTRNDAGGFDVSQIGGADAAKTRSNLALGDVGRSQALNDATSNFNFKLPTLGDARGVVQADNALQQGQFDKGLENLIIQNTRDLGRDNNSGANAAAIDAISRFTDANRFGGEREALDLFDKSRTGDLSILTQQIAANQPQVAAPGFTSGTPGTSAAQLVAQTPPPSPSVDLSSAIPFAAGGSVIKQLQQEEQTKALLDYLKSRQVGNQGAI